MKRPIGRKQIKLTIKILSHKDKHISDGLTGESTKNQYSLGAQLVKKLPSMQETLVQFLGREDPLEKATATHSSILAWRSPWSEEPGRLQSMGSQRVGRD